MLKVNELYSPDYQQVHGHHEELIKKMNQERLILLALATSENKSASSHKWEWLRRWFSVRRSAKMAQAASRLSDPHGATR